MLSVRYKERERIKTVPLLLITGARGVGYGELKERLKTAGVVHRAVSAWQQSAGRNKKLVSVVLTPREAWSKEMIKSRKKLKAVRWKSLVEKTERNEESRFLLRMPAHLYEMVRKRAETEKTSINALIVSALEQFLGVREHQKKEEEVKKLVERYSLQDDTPYWLSSEDTSSYSS